MPETPTRLQVGLVVGGVLLTLVLTACGSDEGAAGAAPDTPSDGPALWNPCDGLEDAAVAAEFDASYDVARGTDSSPRCTFTPTDDEAPSVDVNYSLFPGTLDELFATFGEAHPGSMTEISSPVLRRADEAAMITSVRDRTLAVTGFVKNGNLVQVVNVVDPAPFDRTGVSAGVRRLLGDLATHAGASGVAGDS